MTEWQIFVLGALLGGLLWQLYSIDRKLGAILFVLRHQAGLDQDD